MVTGSIALWVKSGGREAIRFFVSEASLLERYDDDELDALYRGEKVHDHLTRWVWLDPRHVNGWRQPPLL